MTDIDKLVRENVKKLVPYSCARDEFSGKTGIFMDANENPFGTLNRYPDPYQKDLKKAVAEIKNIDIKNIFLGNGSDEIIDLCFRTFCCPGSDKVMIFPPTYGMYEVSAAVNDVKILKIPLKDGFQIDTGSVMPFLADRNLKLIFICSPNNPTGNAMDPESVRVILENSGCIVVMDEAYSDFSEKESFISLLDKYDNLIVMQTFSKALGLAAARIGMAFANPRIVGYFNKLKPPYNISTINQKTALRKLGKPGELRSQIKKIKNERKRVMDELNKLDLVEKVYPSDANFLFVKVKDATSMYNDLIRQNIIIRNRSSLVENCLRITIGKKGENDKLIRALKKFPGSMQ